VRKIGECCICGQQKELSFEHVPPKAAFNNAPVLHSRYDQIDARVNLDNPPANIIRKGIGAHALCEECNNKTGHWYGGAYSDFAKHVMDFLNKDRNASAITLSYKIFPLRIIKQVVCLFFSVNGRGLGLLKSELVDFVLDKHSQNLPVGIRVYAFSTLSERSRTHSFNIRRGINHSETMSTFYSSEVVSSPLGFVMTIDSVPPCYDLYDISYFAQFGYEDQQCLSVEFLVKTVYSSYPCDYRTKEQIDYDFLKERIKEKILRVGHNPTSTKSGEISLHIPFLGSGPVTGLFYPKVKQVEQKQENQKELMPPFLHNCEYILIIGSVTQQVNGELLTVSHISNFEYQYEPVSFYYKGLSEKSATRYGWKKLVEFISSLPDYREGGCVAIISDFDIENHKKYNAGELPIFGDFYLPKNFRLVNAEDQITKRVVSDLTNECLTNASDILEALRFKAIFKDGKQIEMTDIPTVEEDVREKDDVSLGADIQQ